jgi:cell division protease FtsH
MITYALGGRAAEKLVFNRFTTGAGNDIEKATNIARKMVCEWGMSEKLGPIAYGAKEEEIFLGREITKHKDFSEQTAQDIDSELKKIIMTGMQQAEKLLSENIDLLHRLSKELLEREILDSDEIEKIIRGEELPPVKRNGNDQNKITEGAIPDHVQELLEEKKKRESVKNVEKNDVN